MIRKILAVLACALSVLSAEAIEVSNRYRSPRNPERRVRASTELIVLHTTEAPAKSSLEKVSDRGECHYCVTEDGTIYRIVDRDKVAFHAGRSMWKGKEDVDEFSIGIECVGYHDKAMGIVQLRAIRDLVRELKSMYRLSDDKVVCHSHVAYGAPNKWHRFKHRGRKRCGMLFAMPSVRKVLELKTRVTRDDDVRAKRLRNADDYLSKVLYGSVDTMKSAYANVGSPSVETKASGLLGWLGLRQKSAPASSSAPPSPKPVPAPPTPKPAVTQSAPKPVPARTAPKPPVVAQSAPRQPAAQPTSASPRTRDDLLASGYVARGQVNKDQTASAIVGGKWNSPDTYYTIRNKVIPGNQIDPARIEVGMLVWTKKKD